VQEKNERPKRRKREKGDRKEGEKVVKREKD
jgi:hypothetical protein